MPYKGERASKGGHSDLVRNPDVQEFLQQSEYMTVPDEKEGKKIASSYKRAPSEEGESGCIHLPEKIVASDASPYSEPIEGMFPSTQVGYVKNSLVLIDVNDYQGLSPKGSNYVDPFKVAEMHRNADAIAFTLPGSNVRYKSAKTVKDGFRRAIWDQLSDERTSFSKTKGFNVAGTLLALQNGSVHISKCPSCNEKPVGGFVFNETEPVIACNSCKEEVFLTDSLRIHEQVSDYGDCSSAITRFMNVIEHLVMATFIRVIAHHQPKTLGKMAFILDGPMAIFGQPAKIHARLMALYHNICTQLAEKNIPPPVIMSLQKTGQVVEHARSLARFLPNGSIRLIDDEYRDRYISNVSNDCFGYETYYGQDFIFKTETGRVFAFAIPYPFSAKGKPKEFAKIKVNMESYSTQLIKSLDIIRHFELDLHEDAVVPIALAHRHASISLMPGGKVLELISKHGLAGA